MRHTSSCVLRITRSRVTYPTRGVYDTLKQLQLEPPTPSEWGALLCPNGDKDGDPAAVAHRLDARPDRTEEAPQVSTTEKWVRDWYCTACGELMRWIKGKGYQCRKCDG